MPYSRKVLQMSLTTNVIMKKQESNCICLGFFSDLLANLSLAMGVF